MEFYINQFLTGLAGASHLFFVAAGLSIIFGVTRIVNFAHGSFFMLGAYFAYTLVTLLSPGPVGFWGAILLSALGVGVLGVVIEVLVLRRIYQAPELFHMLATYGIVLIVRDAVLAIWGPEDQFGPRAPGLDGAVEFSFGLVPEYDLALIVLGPLVLGAVWLLFHRTRWGILVRAATQDREMTAALGNDERWLFTSVFFVGSFLAGLGGALQEPVNAAHTQMDITMIAEAFVVTVVGGMGSILGAYLAAVLIAELNAFGILIFPEITIVLMFAVMAVVLIVRPWGLLGRPEGKIRAPGEAPEPPYRIAGRSTTLLWAAVILLLLIVPVFASDFVLVLLVDVLIFSLFAMSLHVILGPGGLVSFGHAAYFGLGAYGAAMLFKYLATPMSIGLLAAPLVAAIGALIVGWFCVRLTSVYFAMLTLAFAQILWSIVFQWRPVTGGDDGILGVWPSGWASGIDAFYYLTFVICAFGIYLLRRILFAPFGYALRGARDSPLRAEAIGIDVRRRQWLAFILAGTFAGIAGGLYVYSKGSVFPTMMSIPRSIDGLMMVLLGGIKTLAGPIVGASLFQVLEDQISRLAFWQAIMGGIILVLVLTFPQGVAGFFRDRLIRGESDQ